MSLLTTMNQEQKESIKRDIYWQGQCEAKLRSDGRIDEAKYLLKRIELLKEGIEGWCFI